MSETIKKRKLNNAEEELEPSRKSSRSRSRSKPRDEETSLKISQKSKNDTLSSSNRVQAPAMDLEAKFKLAYNQNKLEQFKRDELKEFLG